MVLAAWDAFVVKVAQVLLPGELMTLFQPLLSLLDQISGSTEQHHEVAPLDHKARSIPVGGDPSNKEPSGSSNVRRSITRTGAALLRKYELQVSEWHT